MNFKPLNKNFVHKLVSVIVVFFLMVFADFNIASARPTVAVAPFENASTLSADGVEGLHEVIIDATEYLMDALFGTNRFEVLTKREDIIPYFLEEMSLSQKGITDPNTTAQIGKMRGAKYLLCGKIANVSAKTSGAGIGIGVTADVRKTRVNVTLTGRLVNVETGVVICSAIGRGNSTTGNAGIGLGYRDSKGRPRTCNLLYAGSYEITSENAINALEKAAFDLVDNLVARIEGKPIKRRK